MNSPLSLATKNALRNKRRTVLTVLSIATSLFILGLLMSIYHAFYISHGADDQALRLIMEQAGEKFDPVVVRVFVNMIGMYPIGTLAILNDGSMGVVVHTVPEDARRPIVKVVLDPQGGRVDGAYVDLSADHGRQIVGAANPYEYKINVLKYLVK